MSDLTKRLRGIYEIPVNDGAGPLDGKNSFTRTFDNMPPICIEAADRIEALEECLLEFIAEHDNAALDQPGAKTLILHWARNNDMISKARALLEEK